MVNHRALVFGQPMENNSNDIKGATATDTDLSFSAAAGVFGRGVTTNGSTSNMNFGNLAAINSLTTAMTIAAWLKPNTSLTSGHRFAGICGKQNGDGKSFVVQTNANVASMRFEMNASGGGSKATTSSTIFASGIRHHLCGTYDGANMRLYIDGLLQDTVAQTGSMSTNAQNFVTGRNNDGTNPVWPGDIDELVIFNGALALPDIKRIMLGLMPLGV